MKTLITTHKAQRSKRKHTIITPKDKTWYQVTDRLIYIFNFCFIFLFYNTKLCLKHVVSSVVYNILFNILLTFVFSYTRKLVVAYPNSS